MEHRAKKGEIPPKRKKGSGRPRALNKKLRKKIIRAADKDREHSIRKMTKDKKINEAGVSRSTLNRVIQEDGLRTVRKRKTLILSEKHKRARLDFANAMLRKSDEHYRRIKWSDECQITLDPVGI